MLILLADAPATVADTDVYDLAPADAAASRSNSSPELPRELEFSTDPVTLVRPAGSSSALLRTVPVFGAFDIGVGFYSVVGATEKEHVRRRTDPSHDIRGRDSRVAAVGMSLRF